MRVATMTWMTISALSCASLPAPAQQAVYMVRHAEQADEVEDPPLTDGGRRRARALAEFLSEARITAVYSSEARRTLETARPAAAAAGVEVRQVPRDDPEALIARIRREEPEGRVLVVGHSETLPRILRALGHPGQLSIDRADYDNVFVVIPEWGATPTVLRQRLRSTPSGIFDAVLPEDDAKSPQVSTAQLREILAAESAVVLDVRPRLEWAISHIPGALNVAPQPGMPMHLYTSDAAEVERLMGGDRTRPLVLYCNGPFCGKANRVALDLLEAGFRDVRRYQLGAPVWRALGGVMVIEPEGAKHVLQNDRTAVWIDARDAAEFRRGSVPGAMNLPHGKLRPDKDQGEVRAAKDDGRLPMEDHNTRIIVFGTDAAQASAVAEAIAREAFHNVAYFADSARALLAALR